jgi:hypothetical protein
MATFLTKIIAFLYKNPLTEDPNDYIARVESQRPLDITQVCEAAVARGGADLPAKTIEHAVDLFLNELEYQVCSGLSVNTKTFSAAPHIKGVFNSPHEPFDPKKHKLLCEFIQEARMRQKLDSTEVTIEGVREIIFYADKINDLFTGNTDGTVTRGKVTELRGHNIKVASDDTSCGIWIRDLNSGVNYQYGVDIIAVNDPSRLLVQLPDLGYGIPHEISITTQYINGAKLLDQPRTAILPITVIEPEPTAAKAVEPAGSDETAGA